MKIRVTGLRDECELLVDDMKKFYDIISVSQFYPNTRKVKESKEGRVYIEARMEFCAEDGKEKRI